MNKATKTITTKATVKDTIALACPVKEIEWIPGWQYEMIHSESGVNENNCIFSETMSAPILFEKEAKTKWHTVLWNENTYHAVMTNEFGSVKFEWSVIENADGTVNATWSLEAFPYTEMADLSDKLTIMVEFLSSCAKHFLDTGEMISL